MIKFYLLVQTRVVEKPRQKKSDVVGAAGEDYAKEIIVSVDTQNVGIH